MRGRDRKAGPASTPTIWKRAGAAQAPLLIGLAGGQGDAAVDVALLIAMRSAERLGARTLFIDSRLLQDAAAGAEASRRLIAEIARSDGVIVAASAGDGALSEPLRRVLDDWRAAEPEILRDRAVACIAAAPAQKLAQWGLTSLRSAVHALGGWPTPMGVAIDLSQAPFHPTGTCAREEVGADLAVAGGQVADFALARRSYAWSYRHAAA